MISRSKYLVWLFAGLFLLLLGIQVYFMYKTYQVKKREIYTSVLSKITKHIDDLEDLGELDEQDKKSSKNILTKYAHKEISKKEFLNYFTENRNKTRNKLSYYIDRQFKKEGYNVAARIVYLSIISIPDSTKLIKDPIIFYETNNKVEQPGVSQTGKWETKSTSTSGKNDTFKKTDSFLIRSKTDFEILNINIIVFKELTLLILCCIAILLSVLILYIFTVNNLIKQQKQVEVLHTVVDNISHEFKTPIATLKIASKTLKKEYNPEIFPLIDRQISRLEDLMLQLHAEETIEGNSKIYREDWDFFVNDLAFTYPDTVFKLNNFSSDVLPFDKKLMETVIKNLCENSVKYGASRILIELKTIQNKLEITISDNGIGMEKKELNSIFEKFYRIQSNNIHNSKGLGLGLFFVKKIIENYNGKIEVSSVVNEGTIFKIFIPYEY